MKYALTALAVTIMLMPVSASAAGDSLTGLPVYPAASALAMPPGMAGKVIHMCGHDVVTNAFVTTMPYATVVGWYKDTLHESPITHVVDRPDDNLVSHFSSFPMAGGSKMVNVTQTTYTGSTAKLMAARSRKVLIGFSTYVPALSGSEMSAPGRCNHA